MNQPSNQELRDKLDEATETIRQLLDEMARVDNIPLCLNLTPNQRIILGALMRHKVATRELLSLALYAGSKDAEVPLSSHIVQVQICYMRKKIALFDIKIETKWGVGWSLPELSRTRISNLNAAEIAVLPERECA